MQVNSTGARDMRKARSSWEEFDSLPREIRDAINYGIIKYSTRPMKALIAQRGVAAIIKAMAEKDAQHVAQVWEEREANDFLKELGL